MATRAGKAAATAVHTEALRPVIQKLAADGITGTTRIARALNDGGYPAIRGGLWVATQVEVLLKRLGFRTMPNCGLARSIAQRRALADTRAKAVAPLIDEMRELGAKSFAEVAKMMNERGIRTCRGNKWSATQVWRAVTRLSEL